MPKNPRPARHAVPGALVPATAKRVKHKLARVVAEAKEDIRLILRRKADTVEAMYDIGEALVRLRRPEVAPAMGFKGFAEMVEASVGFSARQATDLVQLVTRVSREDAIAMGKSRALALVEISDVTPEDDTAGSLHRKKRVTLPGGAVIDVDKASVRELQHAAKLARSRAKPPARGSHVTSADLDRAAALQARLRKIFPGAKVTAVAGRPGSPTTIRVERVPLARVKELGKSLAK